MDRGFAHLQLNDPQSALNDFNSALILQPKNYGVLNNRANLLMNVFQQIDKAKEDLDVAISLVPNEYIAYKNRGFLKGLNEDFQGSFDDFKICLKLLNQQSSQGNMISIQMQEVKDLMRESLEKLRDQQSYKKKQKSEQ